MPGHGTMTFRKDERLCGKKDIDSLFTRGGSRSMSAFPLRLVYAMSHADGCKPGARMLVSVPKRCFKRAVKRNRVKRQVREAYRKNKDVIYRRLDAQCGIELKMAFIWLDDKLWNTAEVETRVANLLQRIAEKLDKQNETCS